MGPLVSPEQERRVLDFVAASRSDGGTVLTGGRKPEDAHLSRGNFVLPTVVADLPQDSRVVREEIFGPVLAVSAFTELDDAVRLANDTRYGLFASVWTKDLASAHTLARRLDAGMVNINDPPTSFPQTPFGGFKESGIGFEQGAKVVENYTRRKNVLVNLGGPRKKK